MKNKNTGSIIILVLFTLVLIVLGSTVGCSPKQSSLKNSTAPMVSPIDLAFNNYQFTTQEQLIADTAISMEDLGYNPHDSHYGNITCSQCHQQGDNGISQLWCTTCHIGMKSPDGWTNAPISGFTEITALSTQSMGDGQ